MAKKPHPESTPKIERFASLRRECESLCRSVLELTYLLKGEEERRELTTQERVDIGFLCRDASDFLDKAKKSLRAAQDAVSERLGAEFLLRAEDDALALLELAGHYATGSVDVKVVPLTPSRTDPQYIAGLVEMGIPRALVEGEVIELRWGGLVNYIKQCAADGKRLPAALRHHSTPYVVFRRRKILD